MDYLSYFILFCNVAKDIGIRKEHDSVNNWWEKNEPPGMKSSHKPPFHLFPLCILGSLCVFFRNQHYQQQRISKSAFIFNFFLWAILWVLLEFLHLTHLRVRFHVSIWFCLSVQKSGVFPTLTLNFLYCSVTKLSLLIRFLESYLTCARLRSLK